MANIGEQLIGSALQSSRETVDVTGNIQKGAELGMQIEQMKAQRAQIEAQKQTHQLNKINSVMDTFKIASEAKDPKLRRFLLKNVAPGKIKALGLEDFFSPQALEMAQTSDEALAKITGLQMDLIARVEKGEITSTQAMQEAARILNDPEELTLLDTDRLTEAQKFSTGESNAKDRARLTAEASLGKQIQAQGAAGDVEESKTASKLFTEWTNQGGDAGFKNRVTLLKQARKKLKDNEVKFGGLEKIPLLDRPSAMSRINPKGKALYDSVQSTMNIKLLSGDPNPTAQQIQDIRAFALDPALDNDANIAKLDALIQREERAQENLKRLFQKHGKISAPKEGDTKEWQGKTYKLIKGMWEEQK